MNADTQPTVQTRCDEARGHLHAAYVALMDAYSLAAGTEDAEQAKTLRTVADLAGNVSALCITLPRLTDVPRRTPCGDVFHRSGNLAADRCCPSCGGSWKVTP